MTVAGYRVPKAAALLVWLVLWEIVGRFDLVLLFPPFTEVLRALGEVVTTPSFAAAARLTGRMLSRRPRRSPSSAGSRWGC